MGRRLDVDQRIGVEASAVGGVESAVQQQSVSGGWCLPVELEEEASREHAGEPVLTAFPGSEFPGPDLA